MDYIKQMIMKVKETEDEFIFQSIAPFCEEITHAEISKQELIDALVGYKALKEENERLKEEIEILKRQRW